MTGRKTPTYLEAKAAKRGLRLQELDPGHYPDAILAEFRATLRARGQYLSERQRASPTYRANKLARNTKLRPEERARQTIEIMRAQIDWLRYEGFSTELEAIRAHLDGY